VLDHQLGQPAAIDQYDFIMQPTGVLSGVVVKRACGYENSFSPSCRPMHRRTIEFPADRSNKSVRFADKNNPLAYCSA
jgi:hypothetical protein